MKSVNGVLDEQFNEMISYSTNFLNLNKLQYLDLQLARLIWLILLKFSIES